MAKKTTRATVRAKVKAETTRRKHDPFFRYIYCIPENTNALLKLAQRRTPALRRMLSNVDMESLEPIPGRFSSVGEQGEADLAFKAKSLTGGPDAFVGILLEHKSVKKDDVLAQIYRYVFEVMVNKSRSDFMWLPTKAIIIYNGKTDWDPVNDFRKKRFAEFSGGDLPFECAMVNLANIRDTDCKDADNAVAAIGTLVMKHAYDPDGLRGAGTILTLLLDRLDNDTRATIVKKIELYLKSYVDRNLVKEMAMAFKSIGQRMGFVSIADAERKAKAVGRRKGLEEGRKVGVEEGRKVGIEEGRKVGVEEGRKVGREEGLKVGILQEQANSEKKMRLFVKRIAKKMNVSEAELLALKP
ncbi:MAG: Rpn family recombination-promoting nuclease/putative transposase [Fibrobacter sp.]|nr:Rpn family recombination-promoting nuclease/putative transposase [Fibrobacter sp.]